MKTLTLCLTLFSAVAHADFFPPTYRSAIVTGIEQVRNVMPGIGDVYRPIITTVNFDFEACKLVFFQFNRSRY